MTLSNKNMSPSSDWTVIPLPVVSLVASSETPTAPTTSETPSASPAAIAGPVSVCVDRPLLALDRPVTVVNGLQSSLAFGATFPEARDRFWDGARLAQEWPKPGRRFLVTGVVPERSVVRTLPAGSVRLIAEGGGRWLYANVEK